jgi:hypothetical protein
VLIKKNSTASLLHRVFAIQIIALPLSTTAALHHRRSPPTPLTAAAAHRRRSSSLLPLSIAVAPFINVVYCIASILHYCYRRSTYLIIPG